MRAFALLALCLPATALAGNPEIQYAASIGEAEIDSVVELPLQAGVYGDSMPYIEVKYAADSEDSYLFLLDMGGDQVVVSKGAAEDHGDGVHVKNKNFFGSLGKKKDEAAYKRGGKVELTNFEELYLGEGLVLRDVQARVGSVPYAPLAVQVPPHRTVSGIIGVGALGLPVALLPSEGVVRIAPAEQGQAILDAVGGTVLPFVSVESEIVKTYKGKEILEGYYTVIDGEVAGQPVKLTFSTADLSSDLRRSVALGDVPTLPVADVEMAYAGLSLGGQALDPDWIVRMDATIAELPYLGDVVGHLGYNFLIDFDIAVDPVSAQVALRPAKAQQREWDVQGFIALKARELEPEEVAEGEEPKEKTEEDLENEKKERASTLAGKAWYHMIAAEPEAAIAAMEEATSLDADPCELWDQLGDTYMYAHRFDDAAVAFQKSFDRYVAWASLSKEEREEIEEMEDEEREASGVQPQDLDACFQAPGMVAYGELLAGNFDKVHALYAEHVDLHPNIGVVDGMAYLLEGNDDAAQGPLRHALNMGARSVSEYQGELLSARIALAELYRRGGDLDTAIANWERERKWLAGDPFAVQQYADLIRTRDGAAAVVPALQAMGANFPDNPVVHTVLANELAAAGQADAAKAAYELAAGQLAYRLSLYPNVGGLHGVKAWHLVQVEDWAGAKEEAQKALTLDPVDGYAHWAMIKVAEIERKLPMALKHTKLAKSHHMGHYFFATLPEPKLKITAKAIKITETALDIPEKVFFQTGSAVIDERSYELLDAIAQVLTEHPELAKVSIEGHTDSDGDDKANKKLSQERADAVLTYLVAKGVAAERLAAKGWGEEKPLGSNDTDEGKAANRRVEFLIVK